MLPRQLPLILAVAWCAVLFGAASVVNSSLAKAAGQNGLITFSPSGAQNWSDIVKQQSPNFTTYNCGYEVPGPTPPAQDNCDPATWVSNPYGAHVCVWDMDDELVTSAYGQVPGNTTVTDSRCIVADTLYHLNTTWVNAKSADLVVTISFAPQNVSFTALMTSGAFGTYDYRFCVAGPTYFYASPTPIPIASSNGGKGVLTTVTLSIRNPTSRTTKSVGAYFGVGRATHAFNPCVNSGSPFNSGNDDANYWLYNG